MRNYKIFFFSLFGLLVSVCIPLVAQDSQEEEKVLEEIVVLGSRKVGRSLLKSSAPIDVIDAHMLESSGFTQTIQTLKTLLPSFTASQTSINDGTDYVRPATLRGLGPEHVLVLVNGKRKHTSAMLHIRYQTRGSVQVDLNTIPSNFIDRIEVLRDGAAAQYGSDAIAGVMNIILKKSTDFTASVSYGTNLSIENSGYAADEALLPGEDNSSFTKGYYYNDWSIGGFGKTTRMHVDGQATSIYLGKGFSVGNKNKGVIYVMGQFRRQEGSNRAGLDPRMQYFGKDASGNLITDVEKVRAANGWDSRESNINRDKLTWYGQSAFTEFTVGLNGEVAYRNHLDQLYFNVIYDYRLGRGPCIFRRSLDDGTIRSKYPDGFLPEITPIISDLSAALGYKSKLENNWVVEVSTNVGRNSFNFIIDNTANVSLGEFTAANFLQKTQYDAGSLVFLQWNNNVDVTKSFANLFGNGNDLSFAFGGEIRYEQFNIVMGEPGSYAEGTATILDGPNQGTSASAGCQCFPGFQSFVDESRVASGLYIDVEADFLKKITLGVAGRYEYYTDFGSTINGKASFRWQFVKPVAFRATVSTGFRAPALSQSFFSSISTDRQGNQLVESGTFPVTHPIAIALGAKPLKAETSINLSAGFVAQLGDILKVTLDGYYIVLNNRVTLSEDFKGIVDTMTKINLLQAYFQTQGVNATQGSYFTNAINTSTWGVDLVATFQVVKTKKINFDIILSSNYNQTTVTNKDEVQTPEALKQYSNTPLLGEANVISLEQYNPRTVTNLNLNLAVKDWNFIIRTSYYGEFINPYSDRIYNQMQPGTIINGLESSYRFGFGGNKRCMIAVGVDNLLDIYPVRTYKAKSYNGIFQYGPSPFGFNGRFIYGRLSITL